MPDISGLAALDVLVGLFFLYFLLSIVCSSVQEFIAQVLNLRAKTLEDGVRNLTGDDALTDRFFRHPRLKSLSKPRGWIRRAGRGPSYIPSRVFAVTLMDTLFPEEHGRDVIAHARQAIDDENVPARVRTLLRDALDHAGDRRDRFTAALERSFDEGMDRVSGWYKRRTQITLIVIAVIVTLLANADALQVGRALWNDDAVRASVVAQAQQAVNKGQATPDVGRGASDTAETLSEQVSDVKSLGLPLGWSTDSKDPRWFDSGWGAAGKVLGLIATTLALTLGAPFWFDLLGRVSRLRTTGKPEREGAA